MIHNQPTARERLIPFQCVAQPILPTATMKEITQRISKTGLPVAANLKMAYPRTQPIPTHAAQAE